MVDQEEIERLMYRYFENYETEYRLDTDEYTIAADGTVQVSTSIARSRSSKTGMLPIKFGHVDGDFIIHDMRLTTLKGCASVVNGDFNCSHNQLTTLLYAPTQVSQSVDCSHNQLTTLEHCPKNISELICAENQLKNLESAPSCHILVAYHNPFEHFRNTPGHIHTVKVNWSRDLPMLGLLSVQQIVVIDDEGFRLTQLEQALNKYAGTGRRGAFKAARELMLAGEQVQQIQSLDHNPFEANARW